LVKADLVKADLVKADLVKADLVKAKLVTRTSNKSRAVHAARDLVRCRLPAP
jgi:uncharacterized protein YjbI with pentapeptide repeats